MLAILSMLAVTLIFALVVLIALIPLTFFCKAAYAVLRRNFAAYFTNPTGYVFLCLFVFLTSCAAFWPHEFFSTNLANLDQLNEWLPYIMLIFIPAITMSIWAEERSQGTDELLLTLPATDFDIVIGKYLAAALIYTVSLLFSQISTFLVLAMLSNGEVDVGLIFATYFGYWLMGLAMLAVGMVASFLTNNLTVGFILGALFNAPLALAGSADTIVSSAWLSRFLGSWSLLEQFQDFGRGVFSTSSFTYFAMIIVIGVYLSVVLVGRRHWVGGRDGKGMLFHYVARTFGLVLLTIGLTWLFSNYDLIRWDATAGEINSLHPDSIAQIEKLDSQNPVIIDAYISADVPQEYAQTRYELVSLLNEFKALSGGKLQVNIYDNLEPFGKMANQASQRYGIEPQMVATESQGKTSQVEVILGAAFRSGLEKVVVPFFDYGIPVEYELVRSISTVASGERNTIGIIRTDAQLFGGIGMGPMGSPQMLAKQPIVQELEKQYDVEEVDPNSEIDVKKYKVLVAVQPSSLTEAQMINLVAAIEAGVPTAIFEDPQPSFMANVPGTTQPRRPNPAMMQFGGGQPEPKGDIKRLFKAIGLRNATKSGVGDIVQPQIVWQNYNPYQSKIQFQEITAEWVFVREEAPGPSDAWKFNPDSNVTKGLEEILFPFAGSVEQIAGNDLYYEPLVVTGTSTGTIGLQDVIESQGDQFDLEKRQGEMTGKVYTLAMHVTAEPPKKKKSDAEKMIGQVVDQINGDSNAKTDDESADSGRPSLDVIYVSDIDVLSGAFVGVRARPGEINFRFDNVSFILNIVDVLADESRYVNIRNRKIRHATLRRIEQFKETLYKSQYSALRVKQDELKKEAADVESAIAKTTERLQKQVDELVASRREGEEVDLGKINAIRNRLQEEVQRGNERKQTNQRRARQDVEKKAKELRRTTDLNIASMQKSSKLLAVLIPPIPPLLIGLIVFLVRRVREREGMSKQRMRFN